MHKNVKDLTGQTFGRLTVIEFDENKRGANRSAHWICQCSCPDKTIVSILSGSLLKGSTKSCGCLKDETKSNLRHGLVHTKAYSIWSAVKQRCYNENNQDYPNYGGRGIKMSKDWYLDFKNFYEDMGECPEGYSIERISVNGNYCKENCCWIPFSEQSKNTRNVIFVEYSGKRMSLSDWCRYFKMNRNTFWERIKRGWTMAQIAGNEPRNGKYYPISITGGNNGYF